MNSASWLNLGERLTRMTEERLRRDDLVALQAP